MKILIRTALSVLSIPVFSRIWGRLARIKHPGFMIQGLIKLYRDVYDIDMNEYKGQVEDYASLSEFFIRPLDPSQRPLNPIEGFIVSPSDGVLTKVETIYEDKATQVKGIDYPVSDLVRYNLDFSKGWHVATIYLAPSNYHRFHFSATGELDAYCHAKGKLYPVNTVGVTQVKELLNRNERVIVRLKLGESPIYLVAVGATFVGSIKMEFIEKVKRDNKWKEVKKSVEQLEEMGRFEMGSTIVMVIPADLAEPVSDFDHTRIKVGEPVFQLKQ
jgi:phosphatidylserine decarboxylase